MLLEKDPNRILVVIKTDVKNAFNSIHRHHLLHQVSSHHPDISQHVFQMYSSPSSLVFQQGNSTVIIPSMEGVHQGDPLGPAFFSTTINSVLCQVQERYPSIQILAYLDDVFLIGLERDTLSALALLQPAFSEIALQISPSKCEIYSPSGSVTLSDSSWSTAGQARWHHDSWSPFRPHPIRFRFMSTHSS